MDEFIRYDEEIQTLVEENERHINEIVLLLLFLQQRERVSQRESTKIIKEIERKTAMLDSFNEKWVERYLDKASIDGTLLALVSLGLLFKNSSPSRFDWEQARTEIELIPLNKALLEAVIDELVTDLKNVSNNINRRAKQSVREIVAENLRRELASKKLNVDSAIDKSLVSLKRQYGDKVNHVITDSLGRRWKMEHYVKTIVQTKLMEVQNRSSINEGISRGFYLGRITFAPDTKDACRFHQGRMIRLDDSVDAPYPTYDELKRSGQVFHMNCRHRVQPILSDEPLSDEMRRQNERSDAIYNLGTRSIKRIEAELEIRGFEY